MTKTLAAMLDDRNNIVYYNSFVNGHPMAEMTSVANDLQLLFPGHITKQKLQLGKKLEEFLFP